MGRRGFLYNSRLRDKARQLRRELTPAERKLWQVFRGRGFLGIKFHRQVPLGPYIVDFCAFKPRVVIEVDGDTHYSPEAQKKDKARDRYLTALGFQVFRFTNREILENLEGVLESLSRNLHRTPP